MYIWVLGVSIQDNSSRPALSHLRAGFLRRVTCTIRFLHHRLGCNSRQTPCEAHVSGKSTSHLQHLLCPLLYFSLSSSFLPPTSLTLFEAWSLVASISRSCYAAMVDLGLLIFQHLPPKCWGYRQAPPCPQLCYLKPDLYLQVSVTERHQDHAV